uniref:Uncharacterized protein n=1 Tax=Haptolina brevifila TaxID=156173 RepID=A0A7S2E3Y0_9EUKA|mmetsp:Transcript_47798/g.95427  ORF Transcript_47798/g.95427 Transcript_47798/m.95427 type:complete len:250 (+) Transcript_47798:55-804(+)
MSKALGRSKTWSHHDQVMMEMQRDESICEECGGWLGRKPGTKPFCTSHNCPGRFAPQGPSPGPSPPKRNVVNFEPASLPPKRFPRSQEDDTEVARIKSRAVAGPSHSASNLTPLRSWLAALLAVPLILLPLVVHAVELPATQRLPALEVAAVFSAALGMCWAGWQRTRRLLRRTIAAFLFILNICALLIIIVIPALPQLGESRVFELCIDMEGGLPSVHLSRSVVQVGPCFRFDISFIDQRGGRPADGL